jgi:hypothetical protein
MFFAQHTALQTDMLYLQITEKAECIAIISDGWSNVHGQGIINNIISTPQPVFYKSTNRRGETEEHKQKGQQTEGTAFSSSAT